MESKLACILVLLLLAGMFVVSLSFQPVKVSARVSASSTAVIRVQYKDGSPRSNADVRSISGPWTGYISKTDSNGQVSKDLANSGYTIRAIYLGSQVGPHTFLHVPEGTTITATYEITPPNVTVLSPQNSSYYVSVPLTFILYDYSPIS